MQRSIQTTIHMYKNHPHLDQIKFVVLPEVREVMSVTNDVAMDCWELMEKYKVGAPDAQGFNFDFSRMFAYGVPQLWQVYSLSDPVLQNQVLSKIKMIDDK